MGRYTQMKLLPGRPITGPSLWYASDLQHKPELFVYQLTDSDLQELDEAVAAVAASGKDLKVSSLMQPSPHKVVSHFLAS